MLTPNRIHKLLFWTCCQRKNLYMTHKQSVLKMAKLCIKLTSHLDQASLGILYKQNFSLWGTNAFFIYEPTVGDDDKYMYFAKYVGTSFQRSICLYLDCTMENGKLEVLK